jgi:outer membrane PBP1 activator LpoA protein
MKQGLLACALVVVALAGCTQTLQTRNDKAAAQGSANASVAEHRQSAEALERQATKSDPATRDELLGRAAEEWYAAGDARRAQRSIEAASALPAPGTSPVRQILAARIELERGVPQRALDRLLKLPHRFRPRLPADALEVEGRARFALGDGGGAVTALVAREHWLEDSASLRANERIIWDGLQRPGLSLRVPAGADATTRGWLELGASSSDTTP